MKVAKMARRKKSRRGRKRSGSAGEILMVIGALLVIAAIAFGVYYLYSNKEQQFQSNAEDLCPVNGARATVAILLDTTDEISPVTKKDIQNRTSIILNELPRFYRLSLYTMNEDGLNPSPKATLCNPGKLNDMGQLARDGITANPEMIKGKYNQFKQTMSRAIDQILAQKFEAQQSPLLGSLQNLSVSLPTPTTLDADKYPAGRNKIIYVTDLLEHTPIYSMYVQNSNLKSFQRSRANEKFGKKYEEDIEIWQVQRNKFGRTTAKLQKLWFDIFENEFGYSKYRNPPLTITPLMGEK